MRYTGLIIFVFLLVGCVEPDPWRASLSQERVVAATNAQASTAAQISQAQAAQDDARRSQELLQALQSQNAIVQGQTAQAQALAQVEIAKTIVEATRPNYTPLYAGMAAMVVIVVVWLIVNGRRPVTVAPELPQVPQPPRVIYQSNRACAWLRPDGTIILRRLADGCERVYMPGDEFYSRLLAGGE